MVGCIQFSIYTISAVTFILKINGGRNMGWEKEFRIDPSMRRKVKNVFEEQSVVDELMEDKEPMKPVNSLRETHQKLIFAGKELGTLIDKFEVAQVQDKRTDQYKQLFSNSLQEVNDLTEEFRSRLDGR